MKEQDWIDNTIKTPFYSSKGPLKLMLLDGTLKTVNCPSCCKSLFTRVLKWKKVTQPDPSHH